MYPLSSSHPILSVLSSQVFRSPIPANLTFMWNFGSLLGLCLIVQILSGLFLAMHYTSDTETAFSSVSHIMRDVNYGWLLRMIHANGASLFFICLYCHVARGVYYNSYRFVETWSVGVVILLLVQATAFLGYVLPWGQMSLWGAMVITNLLSSVPFVGRDLVYWLWGGFAVSSPTLTRFFALHYLMPFVLVALVVIHLTFLHQQGSGNPLGLPLSSDKVWFHPFYSVKDLLGFIVGLGLSLTWVLWFPWTLGDPENFLPATPSVTPQHIQPEWYFLFAYAILRSIPNKLGGVIALVLAMLVFLVMPFFYQPKMRGLAHYPFSRVYFWSFVVTVLLLTWIGARPAKDPYIPVGQWLTVYYFSYFFIGPVLFWGWDRLLRKVN